MQRRDMPYDDILSHLDALSQKAAALGLHTDIYVYGGAGLLLSRIFRRAASDVDAYIHDNDDRVALTMLADEVAAERGIPQAASEPWLEANNLNLSDFMPVRGDFFSPLPRRGMTPNDGLRIHILKPDAQLAFKLIRMSPTSRDFGDMSALRDFLGLADAGALARVWQRASRYLPIIATEHVTEATIKRRWLELDTHDQHYGRKDGVPRQTP